MTSHHEPEAAPPDEAERAVLERRAERLRAARRDDAPDDAGVVWVAELPLGDQTWALPLESLRAAVPLRLVTPVPLAPPHVLGVLGFEGGIIAAVSLATLSGGGAVAWRQDPAILIVLDPGDGDLLAIDSERVPKPAPLPRARVEAARAASDATSLADVVTTADLRPVHLIDPARLAARVRGAGRAR